MAVIDHDLELRRAGATVRGWHGAVLHFMRRYPLGAIGALFVLGVAMDSRLQMSMGLDDLLASLFSVAQMAIGLPYFVARTMGFEGDVRSVTFEYGNTFTAVAGLLNILVALDAWDTALGRKR